MTSPRIRYRTILLVPLYILSCLLPHIALGAPVGVCYGRVANNLPPPEAVIDLLRTKGISRVRLFNPDPIALRPFLGTGIQLVIGVPNEILPTLADGTVTTSIEWLQSNIFAYILPVQVGHLAVGNEIMSKDTFYTPYIVPAIYNLYLALQKLGLANIVKLSTSHASTILSNSYPPSAGAFDPNLKSAIIPLLQFLRNTGSPLMINVYPFFSYIDNEQNVTPDYALFRSTRVEMDNYLAYTNIFDATIDAFIYAMEREGFYGIPVMVTETGWPTAGGDAASPENALAYNSNVVHRSLGNFGTPKRPGVGVEVFLFDLFDENEKNGGPYEKHFGILKANGKMAYDMNIYRTP